MAKERCHLDSLIIGKAVSGEKHLKLNLLSAEYGGRICLFRLSRKQNKAVNPDLFDYATLELSKSSQGNLWFVDDYHLSHRFEGIGKNYKALEGASEFAQVLQMNLEHVSDASSWLHLALQALQGWERRISPEAVSLKAFYLLAKNEGYAVDAHWLKQLSNQKTEQVKNILKTPLDQIQHNSETIDQLVRELKEWILAETDIRIPG